MTVCCSSQNCKKQLANKISKGGFCCFVAQAILGEEGVKRLGLIHRRLPAFFLQAGCFTVQFPYTLLSAVGRCFITRLLLAAHQAPLRQESSLKLN